MSYTNIGTTIEVSAAAPATFDQAGFVALTYTKVNGVASVPELGPSASMVSQADLEDGIVRKAHGEVDFGGGTVQMREVAGDAGQGLLKTARANQSEVSVKITRASGLVEYFIGIVMSYRKSEATTGNFFGIAADLQVTSEIIEVAA